MIIVAGIRLGFEPGTPQTRERERGATAVIFTLCNDKFSAPEYILRQLSYKIIINVEQVRIWKEIAVEFE
jgi:hypothetical protein